MSLRHDIPDGQESNANPARVDTFRTEDAQILDVAMDAFVDGDCVRAGERAAARAGGVSFWLGRGQGQKMAWSLVLDASSSTGRSGTTLRRAACMTALSVPGISSAG